MVKNICLPLTKEVVESLHAGDEVLLSGVLYTARDAAHKRLCELHAQGKPFPFDIEGALIYYVGPTPAQPGKVVGSAGPTTSTRMDAFSPTLISCGLRGMLGKGGRSGEVIEAMKKYGCVYFAAIGGAGALIAKSIKSAEIVAWEDLGCEALRRMEVENLRAYVAIDVHGNNLYKN
ncbi:Fe-S-containing hydro-lyase [bacterium]|nr:Fe-S-containing hydro-lyase [bacterium]